MNIKKDDGGRVIYQAGDIVGVANYSILGKLAFKLFRPQTHLFHFLLIDEYLPGEDDYTIVESVSKGPTMGRLSWYAKHDYVVFRVNDEHQGFAPIFDAYRLRDHASNTPETLGQLAVAKASRFGRCGYDWGLYVRMLYDVIRYQIGCILSGNGLSPMYAWQVPHVRNKEFICTELVFAAWRLAGIRLRYETAAPLPVEFINSEARGEIKRIDMHEGTTGETWRPRQASSGIVSDARKRGEADRGVPSTEPSTIRVDRHAPRNPGPDLIARQRGQARNRVHLYRQPFGYPIRACDWVAATPESLELFWKIAYISEATDFLNLAAGYGHAVCRHCQAIAEGKRSMPFGELEHGHGKGAQL